MTRWLAALLLVLWAALGWAAEGEPVPVPALAARVTDLTATLSAAQVAAFEQRLAAFEAERGTQVAVLLVPTTGPESIEQFGIRVMEAWKIGRKGVDDGAILIVAKNDRRLRIEVGYGLEGALNDATAKRIISEAIVPRFKAGDFGGGISNGIDEILKVSAGETALPPAAAPAGGSGGVLSLDDIGDNTFLIGLAVLAIGGAALRYFLGNLLGSSLVGAATGVAGWLFTGTLVGVAIGFAAGVFLALFGLDLMLSGIVGGGGSGGSGGGGFSGGGGSGGGGGASGSW